ncbi:MAG: hypothetical protein PHO12_02285 [Bacteroidales bacterium]|nr:hypothetical protein [Bacteroidales bacterium]MDD4684917.1 hypothetical protein [Bacteroidales bacterium]
MKQYKYILAIAILAIFAVGCTDEEQITNGHTSNFLNNNKSSYQIDSMMYYNIENEEAFVHNKYCEYEKNSFMDSEMISLINHIDVLLKKNQISKNNYTIKEAVFVMETYFNYAIVDKQKQFDTISYEAQNFSFTVDLNSNGVINADELRKKYMLVVQNILSTMGEHFLQYSDLYVTNKTSSSVTFEFGMTSFAKVGANFSRGMIVKQYGETLSIPNNTASDWNYINNNETDEVFRFYSKKNVNDFYINYLTITSPLPSTNGYLFAQYMSSTWFTQINNAMNFVYPIGYNSGIGSLVNMVNATIRASNFLSSLLINNPSQYTNTDIIPKCRRIEDVYPSKKIQTHAYMHQMKFGLKVSDVISTFLHNLTVDTNIFI